MSAAACGVAGPGVVAGVATAGGQGRVTTAITVTGNTRH
jgi:hypothetical protein